MGIPKFFRFTSERYPAISELLEGDKIPATFDNCYLDMNGIIHSCSHPNDGDAHFRISETDMFLSIFSYIDHIFSLIRPQKVFFLAVDGVAPRAKMNQQRSRRFRTAKEAKELREKAERRGEELPEEAAFDSNCITPGTPFMAKLSQQLKYFLAKKVTEDSAWRGVEVILSGHEVPGEGEHKIMEYIRLAKAQPGYDPNTRHCMYGLDADLIMLGLLSHDPHFALLREEVNFGPRRKSQQNKGLETQRFYLLHLSLFREYLDLEFQDLRSVLPFEYSLERIIDDFILINIFVGNDFLPHLPGLHIGEGALPLLFKIYKRVLPAAGGYLNESGQLRVDRLQLILAELTTFEREQFEAEFADASWYRGKNGAANGHGKGGKGKGKGGKGKNHGGLAITPAQRILFDRVRAFVLAQRRDPDGAPQEVFLPASLPAADGRFLEDLVKALHLSISFNEYDPDSDAPAIAVTLDTATANGAVANGRKGAANGAGADDDDEDEVARDEGNAAVDRVLQRYDSAQVMAGPVGEPDGDEEDEEAAHERFVREKMDQWKRAYYKEKMHLDFDDNEQMRRLAYRYVEGLQWVLHYYYDGVASWGWFYDYHYAPKISDLLPVTDMMFSFELGKPFRPFDQLMGVLPALSNQHIPEAFRDLMTDPTSPIIDFYPADFAADLNGKKQDWEAVVKIPFIDENRLLEALDKREARLTPDERQRNTFGDSVKLTYDKDKEYFLASSLPGIFPDIVHSQARIEVFHLPTLDGLHLVKGLCDGVQLGVRAMAGFPSIKTLPHYARLGHHGVNVFQSESRNESVVISIENTYEDARAEQVAEERIGKRIFVNWPFLAEGLVVAVSDHLFRYTLGKVGGKVRVVSTPLDGAAQSKWRRTAERIEQHYSKRYGVLIGGVEVLLHVRLLRGLKRLDDGSFVKEYERDAERQVDAAVQATVPEVVQEDERFVERAAQPIPLEFPERSKVFFLDHHAYGTPAAVVASTARSLAIEIAFFPNQARENAELSRLVSGRLREAYYPAHVVGRRCGVSGLALAKVTSSMLLDWGSQRVNVGLNLKFEAKSCKVLGYSRKGANGWEFSDKTVALVNEYKLKFPEIIETLHAKSGHDLRSASDFFTEGKVDERMAALKAWIKDKGVRDLEAVPLYAEQLGRETVQAIETFTSRLASNMANAAQTGAVKRVFVKGIPRTALLKPSHAPYRLRAQRFELGDRVVSVADTGNVPMSARGVVVGISSSSIDVVFDVPFLAGSTLGDRCSSFRGASVGFETVLNLSQPQFVHFSAAAAARGAGGSAGVEAAGGAGATSALERTLGAVGGGAKGHAASRGGHGAYRPPNMMRAAPGAGTGRPAAASAPVVQILPRHDQPQTNGRAVRPGVPFAGVASGRARPNAVVGGKRSGVVAPTGPGAGGAGAGVAAINPHLAALSLRPAAPRAATNGAMVGYGHSAAAAPSSSAASMAAAAALARHGNGNGLGAVPPRGPKAQLGVGVVAGAQTAGATGGAGRGGGRGGARGGSHRGGRH